MMRENSLTSAEFQLIPGNAWNFVLTEAHGRRSYFTRHRLRASILDTVGDTPTVLLPRLMAAEG